MLLVRAIVVTQPDSVHRWRDRAQQGTPAIDDPCCFNHLAAPHEWRKNVHHEQLCAA